MLIVLIIQISIFISRCFALNEIDLLPQRCPGPADKGPCNRKIYKWAYDPEKQFCSIFIWGGCAGNEKNRFDTELTCMKRCAPNYNSKFRFYLKKKKNKRSDYFQE